MYTDDAEQEDDIEFFAMSTSWQWSTKETLPSFFVVWRRICLGVSRLAIALFDLTFSLSITLRTSSTSKEFFAESAEQ